MAAGNSVMVLRTGSGWTRGLSRMLQAELGHWFATRMWWTQILIWAAIVNLLLLIMVLTTPEAAGADGVMLFNVFLGLAAPVGVCIIMQGAIVKEKRSGTASWVLSKPVSRSAFVLSKLIGNSVGAVVAMLVAQGLIAYLILAFGADIRLPLPGFLAALGIHFVNLLFYLTLTLMLGAIFDHPAPVISIPLALLFFQQYLPALYAPLGRVIPWTLAIPLNNSNAPSIAVALMTGTQPQSYLPIAFTLGVSALFVVVALRVFQRQEL